MRVIDFFDRGVSLDPQRDFLVEGEFRQTYGETQALSYRIAGALYDQAFQPGDAVAVYSPNDARAFNCVIGLFRAGGVWVPINARSGVDDNAQIINATDTRFLFYHSAFAEEAKIIREKCPGLRQCICIDQPDGDTPHLDALLPDDPALPEIPDDPEAVCALFSTGGTTGLPKGVQWTNRLFESMVLNTLGTLPASKPPVHLCVAPMTHAAGGFALILMGIGGTNVLQSGVAFPDLFAAIEEHKVTHLFLPPTAIYVALAQPDVRAHDYSSLEYFIYAAAPMSVDKLREAIDVFGPVMTQVYGQVEAPTICTVLTPQEHIEAIESDKTDRLASCGRPALTVGVEIMDDDANIQPVGTRGEIVIRGSLVMAGYYKNDAATRDATTESGWHRTGDIGFKDEDGFVYIVDRKKDMIISGGFNVFPSEVEQVIWSHDAVRDCAVVGVPDDKWGEAVKAVVELKPDQSLDEDEIIAMCKSRLGSVKTPKSVEIWPELPRSPVGKVLKKDIRQTFWEGRERAV